MQAQYKHYEMPDTTDASVRSMAIWLCMFFATLIVAVTLVFYHAQTIAQYIPFKSEQRFIRPYEQLISRYFSSAADDPEIREYLQNLSDSLHSSMNVDSAIEIKVHYVESDEINAFATLGGHIVVFRGLLEELPDENSLAMVLAHEIAHLAYRDPIASVGRGLALQLIIGFITGGGSNTEDLVDLMEGSGLAIFSREQERRADLAALHGLYKHYGHANGYRTFFEMARKIELQDVAERIDDDEFSSNLPKWLSSHPATDERLRILDAERIRISAPLAITQPLPESIEYLSVQPRQDIQ